MCMDYFETKSIVYEKIIEGKKSIHTNGKLEVDSCIYIEYFNQMWQTPALNLQSFNHEFKFKHLLHVESTLTFWWESHWHVNQRLCQKSIIQKHNKWAII